MSVNIDKAKNAHLPDTDNEGFLLDPTLWNTSIAEMLAQKENIVMNTDHWFVVKYIRDYYELHQSVPEFRKALKHTKEYLSPEKATRKYIYGLFPYGYGQQACKIAGMRKPLKLMLDL
jgi:tRNA 2-thiouridine synthesizing protein E